MQVKVALKTLFTAFERFLLSNNRRFFLTRDANESYPSSSSDSELDANQEHIKSELERGEFNKTTQNLLQGVIGCDLKRQERR